jgi:hypothetical protein
MPRELVAVLLLASWTQQWDDQKSPPMAARETRVVNVLAGDASIEGNRFVGDRKVRSLTISIPAPPADEAAGPRPARPRGPLQLNSAIVEPENLEDDRKASH